MRILGIESSCDETGVAIYDSEQGLLAHDLYSQVDMHKQYGGVVPELASRDHIQRLIPLVKSVLTQSNSQLSALTGIAYTAGPGLIGALLTGAAFARSLAWSLHIPAIAIHHMEGHLLAPLLEDPAPQFPFIALLVSGGHTQLIYVKNLGNYEIIGDTLDDAAGEAFDKIAKLLGLGYPGGAALAKLAERGDASRFHFPRPMINKPNCDFSFSGLKTHVLTLYQKNANPDEQFKADIAAAFQAAIVDTLVAKCQRALQQTGLKRLVIAGGVSANQQLRLRLQHMMKSLNGQVYFPRLAFCTDNGAMIAFAGYQRLKNKQSNDLMIKAKARWDISAIDD